MRKLTALLIALALSLSFAACGGSEESASTETTKAEAVAETTEEKTNAEATQQPVEAQVKFEEIVVIDNEKCLLKITNVDPENTWGYTVKAYLENRLMDKTLMFSVENASVNGIEADPFFAAEVAAGKKAKEEIQFLNKELYAPDVGNFTDIELTFRVYDSDDWSAADIVNETVTLNP